MICCSGRQKAAVAKEFVESSTAATKIQAKQRGKLARKQVSEKKKVENGAATKVQAIQRGKIARQEMQEQQRAATKVQAIQRGKIARQEMQEQQRAATKVQAMQRGKQGKPSPNPSIAGMFYQSAHNH